MEIRRSGWPAGAAVEPLSKTLVEVVSKSSPRTLSSTVKSRIMEAAVDDVSSSKMFSLHFSVDKVRPYKSSKAVHRLALKNDVYRFRADLLQHTSDAISCIARGCGNNSLLMIQTTQTSCQPETALDVWGDYSQNPLVVA